MNIQVAIIGAGPAGSITAHRLASRGVNVVLIDQAKFPRDKPCGDGLTADAMPLLSRTGLDEWAAQFPEIKYMRMSSPSGTLIDVHLAPFGPFRYGRTIPRRLLDARLAEAAVDAGARLLDGIRVKNVEVTSQGATISTEKDGPVQAQVVVLADGSHAPITRSLGLTSEQPDIFAIRGYYTGDPGPYDRLEIHFQSWIMPGYNWLFPMADGTMNVGTGTYTWRLKNKELNLHDSLERFLQDHATTGGRLEKAELVGSTRGHPLRTHFGGTRTHAMRVVVTGDAAGLINPFTGEGIAPAMHSGEIAADSVLNALSAGDFSAIALASYTRQLRKQFWVDRRLAELFRNMLNSPGTFNLLFRKLEKDPESALLVSRIIVGQQSPRAALRPSVLFRLISR